MSCKRFLQKQRIEFHNDAQTMVWERCIIRKKSDSLALILACIGFIVSSMQMMVFNNLR